MKNLTNNMEENDKIKWESCQTWKGSRCPHQKIIEEAALLKEHKSLSELKASYPNEILEKAYSCCEKCEYFEFDDNI